MNESNITLSLSDWFIVPQNAVYYVEDLCKPYIESVSKAYMTIAIYNLFYSFTWLFLKNRKDKLLFKIPLENMTIDIKVSHIILVLDTIFFMLNFFVIGYWLLIHNVEAFIKFPFVKWFT